VSVPPTVNRKAPTAGVSVPMVESTAEASGDQHSPDEYRTLAAPVHPLSVLTLPPRTSVGESAETPTVVQDQSAAASGAQRLVKK